MLRCGKLLFQPGIARKPMLLARGGIVRESISFFVFEPRQRGAAERELS